MQYLVLIETTGKQGFIFSTNKLREQMGASQLIYKAGVEWVLDACNNACKGTAIAAGDEFNEIRTRLLDVKYNPPLESTGTSGFGIEYIVLASGKALLLAENKETAQAIIRGATLSAAREAPGLGVNGFFEEFDWNDDDIAEVSRRLHRRFEGERFRLPGQEGRFGRLPMVADCVTSGLSASEIDGSPENEEVILSAESYRKRENYQQAKIRFNKILGQGLKFTESLDKLETEPGWLAVIHADGNDIGRLFLNFGEIAGGSASKGRRPEDGGNTGSDVSSGENRGDKNREYINKLRRFSIALDRCTEKAFVRAINDIKGRLTQEGSNAGNGGDSEIPIVPIIIGGDDLTLVCRGDIALSFTRGFLEYFEEETSKSADDQDGIIPEAAGAINHKDRLSACAGVAFVKPHFPFSSAYSLVESLLGSAKAVKEWSEKPISALDFHFLFDSSFTGLEDIRDSMTIKRSDAGVVEVSRLYGGPFITSKETSEESEEDSIEPEQISAGHHDWMKEHRWERLKERVAVLEKAEDEDEGLPSGQAHWLIEGMFLGKTEADTRLKLIKHRYDSAKVKALTAHKQGETLFWEEDEKIWVSGLLDAKFAKGFIETSSPQEKDQ